MKNMKSALVLLSFSINFKNQVFKNLNIKDHKIFRYMIGKMIFIIIKIKIDITTAVNCLS